MLGQNYSWYEPTVFGIIYKATNKVNQKVYIGQTSKSLEERKRGHVSAAARGENTLFYNALRKYGVENFTWEIIDFCISKEDACTKEKWWISFYSSFTNRNLGYNCSAGGEGGFGFQKSSISWKNKSKEERKAIAEKKRKAKEGWTEEQTKAYIDKLSLAHTRRTEDEKRIIAERKRLAWQNRTQEEKQATSIFKTESNYKMWNERTPEEKQAIIDKRESTKKKIQQQMTEEERLEKKQQHSTQATLGWSKKTPEQIEDFKQKRSIAQTEYFKNISEDDKNEWKEKIAITKRGKKNPMAKSVLCLEKDIIYDTITQAAISVYGKACDRVYISKSLDIKQPVKGFTWILIDKIVER